MSNQRRAMTIKLDWNAFTKNKEKDKIYGLLMMMMTTITMFSLICLDTCLVTSDSISAPRVPAACIIRKAFCHSQSMGRIDFGVERGFGFVFIYIQIKPNNMYDKMHSKYY